MEGPNLHQEDSPEMPENRTEVKRGGVFSVMDKMKKAAVPLLLVASTLPSMGAKPVKGKFGKKTVTTASRNIEGKETPKILKSPMNPEIEKLEKGVQALGMLTINHQYDKENEMESQLRRPSILKPTGFEKMPLTLTAVVKPMGKSTTQILLPCPRDALDQQHAGCKVSVTTESGEEIPADSKIVYSKTPQGNGYANPFVMISFKSREVCFVRASHVVTVPKYPPFSMEQMASNMDPTKVHLIQNAMATASRLRYNDQINGMDPTLADRHGAGDCGVKAAVARRAGRGTVEAVEGYSTRDRETDEKYNGLHCINIASVDQGVFTFDARSEDNCYAGPLNGFIPTQVGGANVVDEWDKNTVFNATNAGLFRNCNIISFNGLSTPGFGYEGRSLQEVSIPKEVEDYADALWEENMKKYQQ